MTNNEILIFSQGLARVGRLRGAKLAYAVARNTTRIKPVADAIDAARLTLCREHAERDDKGEPKIVDGQFVMVDRAAFDAALKDFFGAESDFTPTLVDFKELDESATVDEIQGIFWMIKEPEN